MMPMKTIRMTLVSAIFSQFGSFLILQDKHNICTFSLNIKLICTHCETGWEKLACLPVSKDCTNKFDIF